MGGQQAGAVNWTSEDLGGERRTRKRKIEEGESICDFFAADRASQAMEKCGCAPCQLVVAQCGKVLQFGLQRQAGMQTQMCKPRPTQRDKDTQTWASPEKGHKYGQFKLSFLSMC